MFHLEIPIELRKLHQPRIMMNEKLCPLEIYIYIYIEKL